MLKNKAFAERTTFLEEHFTFLAQVLSLERKCVYGYDPLLSKAEIDGFGVNALDNLDVKLKMDGVIVAVAHDVFKKRGLKDIKRMMNNKPVLIDVRGVFDEEEAKRNGFYYKGL
jgi:UDP-N-acetyl-D-mannosaminuronate dehydrogenase